MNDRRKAFWVGVVGIATLLITAMLILWNSDFSALPFRSQYQLQVLVPQAPGVAPDTPVRRRGLLIGRVASVEATDDGALITVNVDDDKGVKTNETPRIQTSLMGDAIVEFVPTRPPEGAQVVQPGGRPIVGAYNPNPVDMLSEMQGDLRTTIQALGRAGDEVATLAERLNTVLGGQDMERLARLVENMEAAVVSFNDVMGNIDDLIGDDLFKKNIKEGVAQIPAVLADARAIFMGLEEVAASADLNLRNLQGLTRPLGERGNEIVGEIESSIGNLEELLANGATLVRNINNSEGTLGRLLNDRSLSDNAEATIQNANQAITELRAELNGVIGNVNTVIGNVNIVIKRLRPILDDATIFADKIARDPARLARGVVNRETPVGLNVNRPRPGPFEQIR